MFGKIFKKTGSWIGKTAHTLDKANKWIGKSISNAEKSYSTAKDSAIKFTPAPLRGFTRDAFFALERNPIVSTVVDAKDLLKLQQKNLKDVTDTSKVLRQFMN